MTAPLQIVRGASDELSPGAARFRLIGLEQLSKLPDPVYLVEYLVPEPGLTFLLGAPGAGKTFVALDLALAVATVRGSWFGRKLRGGPVIYALGEGLASLQRRVSAWARANPDAGAGPIAFCDRLPDLCDSGSVLDFMEAITSRDVEMPALVVLDTFSRAIPGADENSAHEMSRAVASLDHIRTELEAAVLVVHHTGKDRSRGARGSSVLSAAADAELQLESLDGIRELRPTKLRDGTLDQRLTFRLVPALGSAHLALAKPSEIPCPLTPSQETSLHALQGLQKPAKTTVWQEAAEKAGIKRRTFYAAIPALMASGKVLDTPRGYVLASEVQGAE